MVFHVDKWAENDGLGDRGVWFFFSEMLEKAKTVKDWIKENLDRRFLPKIFLLNVKSMLLYIVVGYFCQIIYNPGITITDILI